MKQAVAKNYEAVTVNEFKIKHEVIQFPEVNYKPVVQIKETVLKEMIEWVVFSAEKYENGDISTEVLFDFTLDKLILIGTNGTLLSVCAEPVMVISSKRLVVDAKALADIAAKLTGEGDLTVSIEKGTVLFKWDKSQAYATIIDHGFADYKNIVPNSYNSKEVIRWYIRRPVKG